MVEKIKRHALSFVQSIRMYPEERAVFGKNVAWAKFRRRNAAIPVSEYIDLLSEYTIAELNPLIEKYRNGYRPDILPKMDLGKKTPVFMLWFQGEENLPELCEVCVNRVKRLLKPDMELYFLNAENYQEYVDIPQDIIDRFENGSMCAANFSDFIRHDLLRRYGGWWIDAAVFIGDRLFEEGNNHLFYTARFDTREYVINDASRGKWINSCMYSEKNQIVSNFVFDALTILWRQKDRAIDYLAVDYIMWCGYEKCDEFRKMIEEIPVNSVNFRSLNAELEHIFAEETWNKMSDIIAQNNIHMIDRHRDYKKKLDGAITVYGHLVEDYCGK